jgi:hypothetical protein
MIHTLRLAVAPALAVAFAGMSLSAAHADTQPLSPDAIDALAVANCQLDPLTPLTLEEMSPVVTAEADVEVVPGEISAHIVRAEVLTSLGDVQQCTFGVLHRDAQLKQVVHEGTASLALVDTTGETSYGVETAIELGNMGKSSPIDPTTEVDLGGLLTPLENATEDPTYVISIDRLALEVVQIAAHRSQVKAAARQLKAQTKAADRQLLKQAKAAKRKHAAKALVAAQRAHDKRIAAAQVRYERATGPKSVTRPVSHNFTVTGSVAVAE